MTVTKEPAAKVDYAAGKSTLLVTQRGYVLEVQLNRPETRNAISSQMRSEWDTLLDQAGTDDTVRVVTVTGVGPMFSSGFDLKEAARRDPTGKAGRERRPTYTVRQLLHAWWFYKPIVVGVQGYVGPAACHEFVATADFVIAAADTRFSFEELRMGRGGMSGTIMTYQLPMRAIKKLYMMGGWFDAQKALDWDFVQRVVPDGDAVKREVAAWADELAKQSPKQMAKAKEGIHRIYETQGLLAIIAAYTDMRAGYDPEWPDLYDLIKEKGLREALKWRDEDVDKSITKV